MQTIRIKKKTLSYLLLIAMIVATFWVLLSNFEIQDVWKVLLDAKYRWVFLGMALMFLYVFFEGESMRTICGALGVRIDPFHGFIYACIDIYFCAVTPSATGGAPIMMMYMNRDKIPYSKSSVMVLLNMIMYTLSMVVLAAVGVIVCPFVLKEDHLFFRICLIIGSCFSAGLITVCTLGIFWQNAIRRVCYFAIRVGSGLRLIRNRETAESKVESLCTDYAECAALLKSHPMISIKAFLLNLAQRASYFIVSYTAYLALGGHGFEAFFPLFAIQALSTIAVYSIPVPGAVGASEAMFLILYAQVYSEDELMAAMLLTRGLNYYINVLFCAAVTMVYHVRLTHRRDTDAFFPPRESV